MSFLFFFFVQNMSPITRVPSGMYSVLRQPAVESVLRRGQFRSN